MSFDNNTTLPGKRIFCQSSNFDHCYCLLNASNSLDRMSAVDRRYCQTTSAGSRCNVTASNRKCRYDFWDMEKFICLMFTIILLCPTVQGEMRCYCNDAQCVTTGYMCKSTLGRCFTISATEGATVRVVQGCVDSLPVKHQSACVDGSSYEQQIDWPVIRCCREDMCNSLENGVELEPRRHHNETDADHKQSSVKQQASAGGSVGVSAGHRDVLVPLPAEQYTALQRELWFKAAVIAVPIAGVCVLALLVLLAVRMLTTDVQRHRHVVHVSGRGITGSQVIVSKTTPSDDYYYSQCRCLRGGGVRDLEVLPVQRWGDAFQTRRKMSLLQYPGVYRDVALLIDNTTSAGCDDGVGNGGDTDSCRHESLAANDPSSFDGESPDLCQISRELRTEFDRIQHPDPENNYLPGPATDLRDHSEISFNQSSDYSYPRANRLDS